MVEQPVATKIAFIGLGRMGLPMAVNLVSAGYNVTGYDRAKEACDAFAAKGGAAAESARAAASGADVVITMLPTSAIVASCLIGEENALADAAPPQYLCPVLGEVMTDPVTTCDGEVLDAVERLAARERRRERLGGG